MFWSNTAMIIKPYLLKICLNYDRDDIRAAAMMRLRTTGKLHTEHECKN